MNRRTLIVTLSIALIIVLGAVGVWYFFFKTTSPTTLIPTNTGLPFGQGGEGTSGDPNTPSSQNPSTDPAGTSASRAALFRLTTTPVSGAVAFLKNGFTTIRYVERATSHLYDINPVTLEKVRITNNTIPQVYEAHFKNDGSGVIMRSLKTGSDTIDTVVLTLTPPVSTSTEAFYEVAQSVLRGNIDDIAVANNNTLAFTTKDTGGVISSSFLGEKPTTVFSSAFKQWEISWKDLTTLFITTKASSNASGYAYTLNTKTGGLTKLLGPLNALSLIGSPDGRQVVYSYKEGTQFVLRTKNLASGLVSEITPITLAEKCTWGAKQSSILYCGAPAGGVGQNNPDEWYQGGSSFSDRIWRFNLDTGLTEIVADPQKDFNTNIDATHLTLTPDEDYLILQNKKDLSLWALKLK